MTKPWENKSGLADPTAYEAEKSITAEEKRKNELIHVLKYIIRQADFELLNRIEVRDTKTGKTWR